MTTKLFDPLLGAGDISLAVIRRHICKCTNLINNPLMNALAFTYMDYEQINLRWPDAAAAASPIANAAFSGQVLVTDLLL